jgi:hypothetical protein
MNPTDDPVAPASSQPAESSDSATIPATPGIPSIPAVGHWPDSAAPRTLAERAHQYAGDYEEIERQRRLDTLDLLERRAQLRAEADERQGSAASPAPIQQEQPVVPAVPVSEMSSVEYRAYMAAKGFGGYAAQYESCEPVRPVIRPAVRAMIARHDTDRATARHEQIAALPPLKLGAPAAKVAERAALLTGRDDASIRSMFRDRPPERPANVPSRSDPESARRAETARAHVELSAALEEAGRSGQAIDVRRLSPNAYDLYLQSRGLARPGR